MTRTLLLALAMKCVACVAGEQGFVPKGDAWSDWFTPGNPRIMDTGIEIERWSGSEQFVVEWLDERRIAFSEVSDPSLYEHYNGHDIPMPRDYLQIVYFDTATRKKEVYGPGNLVCLKNGRIAYRIVRPSKNAYGIATWTTFLYGEIGKEVAYDIPKEKFLNRFDCEVQDKLPGDKTGNPIRYLSRIHGYIDVGSAAERQQRNARYVRADAKVFELPFIGSELKTVRWLGDYWQGYSLDVYSDARTSKDDPVDMYFLKPDGSVFRFPRAINAEASIKRRTNYFPSRSGGIGLPQQPVRMDMPGRSGAYVDDGYSYRRLQDGFVTATHLSLSSDGCKLPFGSRRAFMDRRVPAFLKILDVCGDKK